jgi:tetratricopeptide (TPR) repeat protein
MKKSPPTLLLACTATLLVICAFVSGSTQAHGANQRFQTGNPSSPPDKESVLYQKAKDLLDNWRGDAESLPEAEKYLTGILKVNPNYALAYVGLARLAYKRGYMNYDNYEPRSLQKAQSFLGKAFSIDPRLFEAIITSGYVYSYQKDLPNAKRMAQEAEKIDRASPETHLLFAHIGKQENTIDLAILRAKAALAVSRTRFDRERANSYLSVLYERKEQYDLAEEAHLQRIANEPDSAWEKINYSSFLQRRGQYDKAIAMAKQALQEMDFGMGHHVLAEIYHAKAAELLGGKDTALQSGEYFRLATEHDPALTDAYYGLALFHRKLAIAKGKPSILRDTERALRRALRIEPGHKGSRIVLDGLPEFRRALSMSPATAESYYLRGIAFMNGAAHDEALADFQQAIALDPTFIRAYEGIDNVLMQRKEWDTIIEYWSKLIAIQPKNARAYLERGGAAFNKGDMVDALRDAERACSLEYQEGCRVLEQLKAGSKGK